MQNIVKLNVYDASTEAKSEESSYSFFKILESYYLNGETRDMSINDVENKLLGDIMELGRRLFQEHVDRRGDGDIGESILRNDGKNLSHKRIGIKSLETIFGRIKYERMGYGHRGESSIFPQDEKLEMPGKLYSYPLQERVCREAVRSSYDEIDETLGKYTGAHVPKRQCLDIVLKSSEDFEAFYEQKSPVPLLDDAILVVTADGKGVVMREKDLRDETRSRSQSQKKSKRLSKGEKKNRKREALVASVYTIKPRIRSIADVMGEVNREEDVPADRGKPEEKRVWASLEKEKDAVFYEMLEEGLKREPTNKTVAFVCDGAKSVQNPAVDILKPGFENSCLKFVIILDIIHVIEYLWKAVYALGESGRAAEKRVNEYLQVILEGRCRVAVADMKRSASRKNLKGKKLETIEKSANYILRNQNYMRYNEYLSAGLPIASGVIEGACKHLVKDRFEISGARWGLQGAEALLKLRAVYQSGDWNDYWKFHISREQKRLHCDHRWKPLNNEKDAPKFTVIRGGKAS
jgi:hypothetical protein